MMNNRELSFLISFIVSSGILAVYYTSFVFGQSVDNTAASQAQLLSFGEIEQPTLLTQSENVYAFWNKDTDEDTFSFFRRSTDAGNSFGKSVNVVASLDLPGLTVSNNKLYVAWEDYLQNTTGGEYEGIFLLTSNDAGATFGNKLMLSQKDLHSVNPKVASFENDVYVIWQGLPDNTDNFDIYFIKSHDGGVTFGDPINLSDNDGYSDLDASEDGSVHVKTTGEHVYVVWKDDVNNPGFSGPSYLAPSYAQKKDDLLIVHSNDRGKTFTQPITVAKDVHYSKVILEGSGEHVHIMIDDFGTNKDLVILSSSDSGATFGDPINLSNNAQGHSISDGQLLLNGNTLWAIWGATRNAENDVIMRVSHDNGASFGEPTNLSSGIYTNYASVDYWDNHSPRAAVSGPFLYVIWDNVITTEDFDEIHNLLYRASSDNGTNFGVPKVVAKDVGDQSYYDLKGDSQNVFVLFMDSLIKYDSESDEDSFELYFKKTSLDGSGLENAKESEGTNYPKEITVSLNAENNPVILGGKQTINVAAYDTLTDDPLIGAKVDVTVDYGFASKKHFTGTLDDLGKTSFSWTIGKFNIPGTYSVEAEVSAEGYGSTIEDTEFEVEIESEDE